MPILKRLKDYLDENGVKYGVHTHAQAFTAQQIAASLGVPGKQVAKVVVIKTPTGFAMAVLPAIYNVDLTRLGEAIGAKDLRLASEDEFKDLFPGCELGAMPPFGNLYNLPVIVDRTLTEGETIVCQAGTHNQTVSLAYKDFERLVNPQVAEFGVHV